MIYFDTSYIVRLFFEEKGWERVRELAAEDRIACSAHGRAETVAAFHRKLREDVLTQAGFSTVIQQFEIECGADAFEWLPISPLVINRVERAYASLPKTVHLRAADALHLACAAENQLTKIHSNDRHLLAATTYFGITGVNII